MKNKLITSLACSTVLSLSIMGASYASTAVGSAALGGIPNANTGMDGTADNTRMNTEGNLMNRTTGPVRPYPDESIRKVPNQGSQTRDNYTRGNYNPNSTSNVAPIGNTTTNTNTNTNANTNGRYRATSLTDNTSNTNRSSNWGWLGLLGLVGLAGMRSRSDERR